MTLFSSLTDPDPLFIFRVPAPTAAGPNVSSYPNNDFMSQPKFRAVPSWLRAREANRPIVGDRAEGRAVGGECQAVDLCAMGGQAEEFLAGGRVPETDHSFYSPPRRWRRRRE